MRMDWRFRPAAVATVWIGMAGRLVAAAAAHFPGFLWLAPRA